jgi:signal transduction histidine kinase
VKNGLKYNNNENKEVLIFEEDNYIVVQDNGIGMTSTEFEKQIKIVSKEDIGEIGLGLNISIAILKEHGFSVECEKNEIGTKIKIKFKS